MIEMGQCPAADVLEKIKFQEKLWLRIVATRNNCEWDQAILEITSGAVPPRWIEQRWEYEQVVLISATSNGDEVTRWLQNMEILIDDLCIKLNFNQNNEISWRRHESKSIFSGSDVLVWPFTLYEQTDPNCKQPPHNSLISENSPSFISFSEGVMSFFGIAMRPASSVYANYPIVRFRLLDCSGRIEAIRVEASEMSITVEGESLDVMKLELASTIPGPVEKLNSNRTQIVRFALPNGLPPSTWVVLKKGSQCIDRKFINHPYTQADSNIEFVAEQPTRVEALVSSGEGSHIEFKIKVPETPQDRKELCRTVAAFANGQGGDILFGVENNGELAGLSETEVTQGKQDTITNFIKDLVDPLPYFDIEAIAFKDGKTTSIIVVSVRSGDSPPYGVKYTTTNTKYYVRRGGTTFEASQEQVRNLARSKPPANGSENSDWFDIKGGF